MTSSSSFISVEEFNLFHAIDRKLYALLVNDLLRDPLESMQIMALWLWLERRGSTSVVKKILSLPQILINELADEAMTCLNCISNTGLGFPPETCDIPLTQNIMEKEISLKFFHDNRLMVNQGLARIEAEVCLRVFSDIMQRAMQRNVAMNAAAAAAAESSMLALQENEVPPDDRTMFVTFSKGYPVAEWEVREFFTRAYGDCIECLYMQEVQPDEQSLFARIVFYSASTLQLILNGMDKAKFTINGKHVWVRKFVPKRPRSTLSPRWLHNLPGNTM